MVVDFLCKGDCALAYADDLGFIVTNLFQTARDLQPVSDITANISSLHLNIPKCVIIPLWKYLEDDVSSMMKDVCFSWHITRIAQAAKYMGFYVGPGTDDKDWERVLDTL